MYAAVSKLKLEKSAGLTAAHVLSTRSGAIEWHGD